MSEFSRPAACEPRRAAAGHAGRRVVAEPHGHRRRGHVHRGEQHRQHGLGGDVRAGDVRGDLVDGDFPQDVSVFHSPSE